MCSSEEEGRKTGGLGEGEGGSELDEGAGRKMYHYLHMYSFLRKYSGIIPRKKVMLQNSVS
jgi:hypothetical protein